MGYVYVIGPAEPVTPYRVKIGKADDVQRRIAELQTACPFQLEVLWIAEHDKPLELEGWIHRRLAKYRRVGEWFELGPDPVAKVQAAAGPIGGPAEPLTPGERRIMAVLAAADGPLSLKQIIERCPSLAPRSVSVLLCRMSKGGVVRGASYGSWELCKHPLTRKRNRRR